MAYNDYYKMAESAYLANRNRKRKQEQEKDDKPWYVDTLEFLQPTLDFISRPQRAVTGAIYNWTDGKSDTGILDGLYGGISGKMKKDTTDILDNLGWKEYAALTPEQQAARNKTPFLSTEGLLYKTPVRFFSDVRKDQIDFRDILEFGGDMLLDPLTYTVGGAIAKGGGKLAYSALKSKADEVAKNAIEGVRQTGKSDFDVGEVVENINPTRSKKKDLDKNIEMLSKRFNETGSQTVKDQLDELIKVKKEVDFFDDVSQRLGTNLTSSGQRKAIERVSQDVYDDVVTKLGNQAGDNRVYTTRTAPDGSEYVVDEGLQMVDGVKAEAKLNPRLVEKLAEFKQNKMMKVADDAAKQGRIKYQNNLIGVDVPFFNIVYTLIKKPKAFQIQDPRITALQVNALTKIMNEAGATEKQIEVLRSGKATDEEIFDIVSKIGMTDAQKVKFLEDVTGKTDMSQLTRQEYDEIVNRLQNVQLRQLDNIGQQQTVRTVSTDQKINDYVDNLAQQMQPLMATKYAKEMEDLRAMNPGMSDDQIIRQVIQRVNLPSKTGDITYLDTPNSPQQAIKKLGKKYSRLKSVSPKVRSLMEDIEYKFSLMDKPNDMLTDQFVSIIREAYSLGMKPYSQMRTKSPGEMYKQVFIDRPDLLEKLANINRILDEEVGQYAKTTPKYRNIIRKLQKDLRDPSRRVKVGYNKDINETVLANPKGVNIAELKNPTGEKFWEDKTIDIVDSVATDLARNKNFVGLDNSRFQIDAGGASKVGAAVRRKNPFNARTLNSLDENVNEMGNVIRDSENVAVAQRREMEKLTLELARLGKTLTPEQQKAIPYLLQKKFPDQVLDDVTAKNLQDKSVEIQELKDQLSALRQNPSKAKAHLEKIENVKSKIAQATQDLKKIRSESSYTTVTKQKEADLKKLNNELQTLKQADAKYVADSKKVTALREKIKKATNDFNKLRSEKPLSRETRVKEAELKTLKDQLETLTKSMPSSGRNLDKIKKLQQLISKNADELEQMKTVDENAVYGNALLKIAGGDEKVAKKIQMIADKMERMYKDVADIELQAGSLKNTRANYFPHVVNYTPQQLEDLRKVYENDPEIGALITKSSGNRFAKERKSYQTMAEVDNTLSALQERITKGMDNGDDVTQLEEKMKVLSELYERDPFVALTKRYYKGVKAAAMTKMQKTFRDNGFIHLPSEKPKDTSLFKKLNEDEARALNLPNGTYVHQEVLDGLGKVRNVFTDKGMEKIFRNIEAATNIWKTITTTIVPSHYWYNFVGLVANNTLAGVGATAYRQASDLIEAQRAGTLTPKQEKIIKEMRERGVLNQTSYADLLPSNTAQMELETPKNWLQKTEKFVVDNPVTRFFRGAIADPMDNYFRMAHYLDVVSKTRSPKLAAESVRKYLFNYSEVTTADRYMKAILPFWNWTKNNLPLQIHKALTTPRYVIAYNRLKEQTMEDLQNDPDLPDWAKENYMKFGGELYNPRPPVQDLEMLFAPNKLASSVSPFWRSPAEIMLNKQFFTGKPIDYDAHYGKTDFISGANLGEYLAKQSGAGSRAWTVAEDIGNEEDSKQWYDIFRDTMIGKSQNIEDVRSKTLENRNKKRGKEEKKLPFSPFKYYK